MEAWFLSSGLKTWYISEKVWFYPNSHGRSTSLLSPEWATRSFPSTPKTSCAFFWPRARSCVFPPYNVRRSDLIFACSSFHTCWARSKTGSLISRGKTSPSLAVLSHIPWRSFSGCRTYHCHYAQSCLNYWTVWAWAPDFSWGLFCTQAEFACQDARSSWGTDWTSSRDASFSYILTLIIYYTREYQQPQSLTNNQG